MKRFLLCIAISVLAIGSVMAKDLPGATQTSHAVSPSGSFDFSVPIVAPKGVNNVQPSMAVSYSSGRGNGRLGVGWDLTGLSAILRCGETFATDGRVTGVTHTDKDKFCLNGQRLILVSGVYGAADSEYRTEIDDVTRIVVKGNTADLSSGVQFPTSFEVHKKNGMILKYGVGGNSAIPLPGTNITHCWKIGQVGDSNGNYYQVTYRTSDGQPGGIDYTLGNSSAEHSIDFIYEPRTDIQRSYHSGKEIAKPNRLKRIDVSTKGLVFRKYHFSYRYAPVTNRSQLTAIKECGSDATCMPAIPIVWNDDVVGYTPATEPKYKPKEAMVEFESDDTQINRGVWADVNGDGRVDQVIAVRKLTGGPILKTWLASDSGWVDGGSAWALPKVLIDYSTSVTHRSAIGTSSIQQGQFIDVNGDGLLDVVYGYIHPDDKVTHTTISEKKVYLNTGSGWSDVTTYQLPDHIFSYVSNAAVKTHYAPACGPEGCQYNAYVLTQRGRFLDINGDGLTDIVYAWEGHTGYGNMNPKTVKEVYLNNGTNWVHDSNYVFPDIFTEYHRELRLDHGVLIDLNGDGLQDWMQSYHPNTDVAHTQVWLNTGTTFEPASSDIYELDDMVYENLSGWANPHTRGSFTDINGDGLTDFLMDSEGGPGGPGSPRDFGYTYQKKAWINTGAGWQVHTGYAPLFEQKTHIHGKAARLKGYYVDVNHDGLVDYAESYKDNTETNFQNTWLNTGAGWAKDNNYNVGLPFFQHVNKNNFSYTESMGQFTDINSDGNQDWVQARADLSLITRLDKNAKVEQLEKITTTTGVEILPTLAALTQSIDLVESNATPKLYTKRYLDANDVPKSAETDAFYLASPIYVTSQLKMTSPDGSGYATTDYRYGGAQVGRGGRGFLGFQVQESIGTSSGISTKTTFEQAFPKTGRPKEVLVYEASNPDHWISRTQNTYAVHSMHSGKTVMPYAHLKIAEQRELSTLENDTTKQFSFTRTTTNMFTGTSVKDYARVKDTTVETRSTGSGAFQHKTITGYTYHGADETNWHVAQINRATVTQSEPNTSIAPIVRKTDHTYYATSGLPHTVIREPGGASDVLLTTTYLYDSQGNTKSTQVTSTTGEPRTERIDYYANGRPERLYNSLDQSSFIEQYDSVCDLPTRSFDMGNQLTTFEYDGFCRETKMTSRPNTVAEQIKQTIYTHELFTGGATPSCGAGVTCQSTPVISVEVQQTGQPNATEFHNTYGLPILTRTQGMDYQDIAQIIYYDDLGRVEKQSQPHFVDGFSNEHWTENTYDALGRETLRELPFLNSQTGEAAQVVTAYTIQNNLRKRAVTSPVRPGALTGSVKQTLVNALGQVSSVIDAHGHALNYDYDAQGKLLETESVGNNAANNSQTIVTGIEYDILGRRTKLTDPSLGVSEYRYNAYDDLVEQEKGTQSPVIIKMYYDSLGRMEKRSVPDELGQYVDSFWEYYDTGAATGQLSYVGVGESTQDPALREDVKIFTYDQFGRSEGIITYIKGQRFDEAIAYNSNGQVDSRAYPASGIQVDANGDPVLDGNGDEIPLYFATKYDYQNGFLVAVSGQGLSEENCIEHWRATKYDALGRVSEDILGDIIDTTRDFKPGQGALNNITSTLLVASQDEIQNITYQYDANNNMTSRVDSKLSITDTFRYDALDRLTFHNYGEDDQVEVRYDDFGNIKYKEDVGTYTYSGIAGPHAVTQVTDSSGLSNPLAKFQINWEWNGEQIAQAQPNIHNSVYQYDERGNIKKQGNREFYWTSFDKPSKILLIGNDNTQSGSDIHYNSEFERSYKREASYDGLGGLVDEKTETHYVGKSYQKITNLNNGEVTHRYSIMAGTQTVQIDRSHNSERGETKYLLSDGLGSTNIIVDRLAEVEQQLHFDPWGMRVETGDTTSINAITDKGYTGHEMDDEVGVINMNARIYDPYLGRFMSADPVLPDAEDMQQFNRYSYVTNNPLKYTDPTGNFRFTLSFEIHGFEFGHGLLDSLPMVALADWILAGTQFSDISAIQGAELFLEQLIRDLLGNTSDEPGGTSSGCDPGINPLCGIDPGTGQPTGPGSSSNAGGYTITIGGRDYTIDIDPFAIIGVGDALADDGHKDWRYLTAGEVRFALENGLTIKDIGKVRVYNRGYAGFEYDVIAPNGHIYIGSKSALGWSEDYSTLGLRKQGTFLHELAHVFQVRSEGCNVLCMGRRRAANSNYNYQFEPGKLFHSYGVEEQAQMVEDRFLLLHGLSVLDDVNGPAKSRLTYDQLNELIPWQ